MKSIVERLEERDIEAWSDPYSCRARGAEAAARILARAAQHGIGPGTGGDAA